MKLRRRLALAFAAATCLTVISAFGLTLTVFKHAQERQLDQSLKVRAVREAEDVFRYGERALFIEHESGSATPDLDYLITYGALYRLDGTIVTSTPTFGANPPSLRSLGWSPGDALPRERIEFAARGLVLRAVLVRVGPEGTDMRLLLLAAPRGDADADALYLLKVMAVVVLVAAAMSLLIGWWIGGRMTRGIGEVVAVARRVSRGELEARVEASSVGNDEEVRTLAADLNQMIDRLAALIDAEHRFVSHAAHELRSPLAALRGELELALRHPRPVEGYKASIEEALDGTNRLIVLAEDLLVLARMGIATGTTRDERATASLNEVISEAVRASRMRAQADRKVEVQVEVDNVQVRGRAADLARMVRNLLDNAVAHAPAGTKVRVSGGNEPGAEASGWAFIAVEDQGAGVPDAIRERIFEPFFRGDAEREDSGAGLGLAIAREIARVHGGDLLLSGRRGVTRFVATLRVV